MLNLSTKEIKAKFYTLSNYLNIKSIKRNRKDFKKLQGGSMSTTMVGR